jgi:23S rRNA (adenine2503-C2)-methyltransferase
MKVFLEKSNCHLAISLHSPFSQERLQIMPIEKTYPIAKVLEELRKHDFSKQRRVSFEYILFNGVNDTMRHAVELVKILRGIDCRVNLIRFHAIPGVDLKSSNTEKMTFFRDYLTNNGITATIRRSRGEDIFAACGMLSTLEKEKNKEMEQA